jgi:hypothetical protein
MRWILVVVWLCCNAVKAQPAQQNNSLPDIYRLVIEGEATVPVATSEKVLDLMLKYANLRDEEAFARMIAQGEVLLVASGTKCRFADPGFFTHEVRIDEGPHRGRYGFVPSEFVKTITAEQQRQENEQQRIKQESQEKAEREQRERLAAEENAKFRTWTSADGKYKREAKMIGLISGSVLLESRDGKRAKVDPLKLSRADQEYAAKWRRRGVKEKVGDPSDANKPAISVKFIRARLVDFQTPNGIRTKMVLVDWKNDGSRPVRAVDANITLLDARRRELEGGRRNQPIFAVADSSPGIAPGEIYREPNDRGFILDQFTAKEASGVRVEIVGAVENGAF